MIPVSNTLVPEANYDHATVKRYSQLVNEHLRKRKGYNKSTWLAALTNVCDGHKPAEIFDDMIAYGYIIRKNRERYILR